jgi:amino acid adenylation domain-containing protein/non-ribosomal peptide synthase protein (TIGR01720 family)
LAYVVYTSGSTGRPKGVCVPSLALEDRVLALGKQYAITEQDRVLQFVSPGFDAFAEEVFPVLTRGGSLLIRERIRSLPLEDLIAMLKEESATILHLPLVFWTEIERYLAETGATLSSSVRLLITGGEPIATDRAKRWIRTAKTPVCNAYGPTETTITASCYFFSASPPAGKEMPMPASLPIGRPLEHTRIYVLDPAQRISPVGVSGELFIAGAGLARGYLDRPSLTAERFVPDPLGAPGSRMYKTGDLGRWRSDGQLEYLGRSDQQIKINGARIEPEEIEVAMREAFALAACVVLPHENQLGRKQLVAYVVKDDPRPLHIEEVRRALENRLPASMLPGRLVLLDKLPLLPNGKIDRKAIRACGEESASDKASYEPPLDETERTVARIWSELLEREGVGRHDDFFALGGHSLLVIRLVGRMRKEHLGITPNEVFENRTVATLASCAKRLTTEQAPPPSVPKSFSLTPTLSRLHEVGWPVREHHSSILLQVPAGLRHDLLIKALQTVIDHHDTLRLQLSIDLRADWHLRIREQGSVSAGNCLRRIDATALEDTLHAGVFERECEQARQWLDPGVGRMLRAVWLDRGDAQAGVLGLICNHLAVDGLSWGILTADLEAVYDALQHDRVPEMGARGTSYPTWSELLSLEANRAERIAELPFWQQVLAEGGELVPGVVIAGNTSDGWERLTLSLSPRISAALFTTIPARYRVSPSDVLVAGLARAASLWRQERAHNCHTLTIDLNGHGREDIFRGVDLSCTLGWFTSLYPVRIDLSAADPDSLEAILATTSGQLRAAPDNGIGYGLLRYLNENTRRVLKDLARPQVSFNFLGKLTEERRRDWAMVQPEASATQGESSTPEPKHEQTVLYPLEHLLYIATALQGTADGVVLHAFLRWATRFIPEADIRRLADLWWQQLHHFVDLSSKAPAGRAHFRSQGEDALLKPALT